MLCSGNGQYTRGRCQCYSGWKGTECDVPASQCIDPQCGGHGLCVAGNCACNTGHKGTNCEQGNLKIRILPSGFKAARWSIFLCEAQGESTQSIGETIGVFDSTKQIMLWMSLLIRVVWINSLLVFRTQQGTSWNRLSRVYWCSHLLEGSTDEDTC